MYVYGSFCCTAKLARRCKLTILKKKKKNRKKMFPRAKFQALIAWAGERFGAFLKSLRPYNKHGDALPQPLNLLC